MIHRFKLRWQAESFVVPANNRSGHWTITGGETWVSATTEDEAVKGFRWLLGTSRCEIEVIA